MPDFLIHLNPDSSPDALLRLLQQPYGEPVRGTASKHAWGSMAVLSEVAGRPQNRITGKRFSFAWVGDLVLQDASASITQLLHQLDQLEIADARRCGEVFKASDVIEKLNGAFAAVLAGEGFLAVITDPLASVQLYAALDAEEHIVALGTHPDLVARLRGPAWEIDSVSVADFLNTGIPCCPHTMHRGVREVPPGTVQWFGFDGPRTIASEAIQYWTPPAEVLSAQDHPQLLDEFLRRWRRAIEVRCDGNHTAVTLSGGMDSRLVLATVPRACKATAATLCDTMNREARLARRIAAAYDRDWVPLQRDPEYLGRTLFPSTRFTGCEGEYHHGHALGFAGKFRAMGVDSVFTGLLMDNNFKAYYARDVVRVSHGGGLLPASYRPVSLDYTDQVSGFCHERLTAECVAGILERRRAFQKNHFAMQRQSHWEWLDGYPYSQACDNTGWVIERRVMPLRLPVMDRAMVDLAFRIPATLKAGGRFFEQAAVRLLGPGRLIPNANDGVRPGSGHVSRLLQRAVRKTQRQARAIARSLGMQMDVPHSWHDFPKYLNESSVLTDLIGQHASRLDEFSGTAFRNNPAALIRNPQVPWQVGYRLIQLAVWRSQLDSYRFPISYNPAVHVEPIPHL